MLTLATLLHPDHIYSFYLFSLYLSAFCAVAALAYIPLIILKVLFFIHYHQYISLHSLGPWTFKLRIARTCLIMLPYHFPQVQANELANGLYYISLQQNVREISCNSMNVPTPTSWVSVQMPVAQFYLLGNPPKLYLYITYKYVSNDSCDCTVVVKSNRILL